MKLIHDWKWVATRAWSVWLAGLAAALSAIEVLAQTLLTALPPGRFAAAAGLVSVAAAVARVLMQREPA